MREENNKRASNIPAGIVRNATVFLLLVGSISPVAGDRNAATMIHNTNPCSHLANSANQPMLEEFTTPDGEKVMCCPCPQNHKFVAPCSSGKFESTVCIPCEDGLSIDKDFHFDKNCAFVSEPVGTTVKTTLDISTAVKTITKAILPNSPNATTLPISLSGVAYDYLIRHSNAEFPNVTENPILSEAKKIKNHTLPKPNDNKNISDPFKNVLGGWDFLNVVEIVLYAMAPSTAILGAAYFVWKKWRKGKMKKQKDEASGLPILETRVSGRMDNPTKANYEHIRRSTADELRETRGLLSSRDEEKLHQVCFHTSAHLVPPGKPDKSSGSATLSGSVVGVAAQDKLNFAEPFHDLNADENHGAVVEHIEDVHGSTIAEARNFFSMIGSKHIPFKHDDARKFGRTLDLTEEQLRQCEFDPRGQLRNPGEMMVHVIDSIRNAMGSEFTPRKVIEYFRENQMILLVERLEAYLRC